MYLLFPTVTRDIRVGHPCRSYRTSVADDACWENFRTASRCDCRPQHELRHRKLDIR